MTRNNLKKLGREDEDNSVEELTGISKEVTNPSPEEEERTSSRLSTPIMEVIFEEEAGESIPSLDTKRRRRFPTTSDRVSDMDTLKSNPSAASTLTKEGSINQTQPLKSHSDKPVTGDIAPTVKKNQLKRTTATSGGSGDEEKTRLSDNPFRNHPNYAPGKRFRLEGETIGWDSEEEMDPTPRKSDREPSSPKFFRAPDLFKKSDSPRLSLSNPYPLKNPSTTPSPPPPLLQPSPPPPPRSHHPPPTPRSNPPPPLTKKLRLPWTLDELAALEEGMTHHGAKWSLILADHGRGGRIDQRLAQRTQIQLKDKARTERQARERSHRPLGVFRLACSHT